LVVWKYFKLLLEANLAVVHVEGVAHPSSFRVLLALFDKAFNHAELSFVQIRSLVRLALAEVSLGSGVGLPHGRLGLS